MKTILFIIEKGYFYDIFLNEIIIRRWTLWIRKSSNLIQLTNTIIPNMFTIELSLLELGKCTYIVWCYLNFKINTFIETDRVLNASRGLTDVTHQHLLLALRPRTPHRATKAVFQLPFTSKLRDSLNWFTRKLETHLSQNHFENRKPRIMHWRIILK